MASRLPGRPKVTTHAAIEEAAFALFEGTGFDETTMADIADELGIGRRTLFRYYPSKNDILWGQFDDHLASFRESLANTPPSQPLAAALRDGVIAFNSFGEAAIAQHRRRMGLLLSTPALLGHSELRYAAWRLVVAEFVAARTDSKADDPVPLTAGRMALALALSAYECWLADAELNLQTAIGQAFDAAADLFN